MAVYERQRTEISPIVHRMQKPSASTALRPSFLTHCGFPTKKFDTCCFFYGWWLVCMIPGYVYEVVPLYLLYVRKSPYKFVKKTNHMVRRNHISVPIRFPTHNEKMRTGCAFETDYQQSRTLSFLGVHEKRCTNRGIHPKIFPLQLGRFVTTFQRRRGKNK